MNDLFTKMHVWTYLGATNRSIDAETAQCRIPIRPDMCYEHGLRAAIIGSSIEFGTIRCVSDAGGIVVDLSYHVRDNAKVSEAIVEGRLVRRGRSTSVTEGRVLDAADGRTIGYGTVSWVVPPAASPAAGQSASEPFRPDFSGSTPAPGTPLPDLLAAMGVYRLPGSIDYQIDQVRPEIAGGDWRSLHATVQQVMVDGSSMAAAAERLGTEAVATRDVTLRMVTAGRVGPFVTEATVLHHTARDATCRVAIVDQGAEAKVIAIASVRVERLD